MKSTIIFSTLCLLSLNTFANTLDFSSYAGEYALMKASQGLCAPSLKIVEEDFLNQKNTKSLSFYGRDGAPETDNIYQLTDLNAGPDFHYTTNPMFGHIDGSYYKYETLQNDTITAESRINNLFGVALHRTTLLAQFIGEELDYTKTEYNILPTIKINRTDKCSYFKIIFP